MVDGDIGVEGEGLAGLHGDHVCAGAGAAADIAPEVGGREIRHRGVVVGVFADVLVHGELLGSEPELLEDVVGRDVSDAQREGCKEGRELHGARRDGVAEMLSWSGVSGS